MSFFAGLSNRVLTAPAAILAVKILLCTAALPALAMALGGRERFGDIAFVVVLLAPFIGAAAAFVVLSVVERKLRLVEEAINSAATSITIYDRHNRLVLANQRYLEMLNLPPGAIRPGSSYQEIARRSITSAKFTGDIEAELQMRLAVHTAADGRPSDCCYPGNIWLRVSKSRMPSGAIVGIGMDVTDYYALKARADAVMRRFSALATNAPVGICQASGDRHQVQFVNDALLAIVGAKDKDGLTAAELTFHLGGAVVDGFTALLQRLAAAPGESEVELRAGATQRTLLVKTAFVSPWRYAYGLPETVPAAENIFIFVDITARTRAEQRIRYLALHDSLTGAGNRAAFGEDIGDAAQNASETEPLALVAIDLDGFKPVNDTFGHATGDALLKRITSRLGGALSPSMSLYRMGGDEFAILCRPQPNLDVGAFAQTVKDCFSRPFAADGHTIDIGASLGTSVMPRDTDTPDTLLHYADLALYKAKNSGGEAVYAFEPALLEVTDEQRAIEFEFRDAIDRRSFEIIYQGQYGRDGHTLVGVEAFTRWRRRRTGALVRPSKFIALAEELGIVDRLDYTTLDCVLRDFSKVMNTPGAPKTIAVNISTMTLESCDLENQLSDALNRYEVEGSRLVLEVARSASTQRDTQLKRNIDAIERLGIALMLDNGLLGSPDLPFSDCPGQDARLPPIVSPTAIKVDCSAPQDFDGAEAVTAQQNLRCIIETARTHGLEVVASNVETEQSLQQMRDLGCAVFQGHVFGSSTQSLEQLLRRATPSTKFDSAQDNRWADPAHQAEPRAVARLSDYRAA